MTLFTWLAGGLTLASVLVLVRTLLRRSDSNPDDNSAPAIEVAKQRRAELDQESAAGLISAETRGAVDQELEANLAADLQGQRAAGKTTSRQRPAGRWAALLVVVIVPALALSVYQVRGRPELADQPPPKVAASNGEQGHNQADIEQLLASLKERLAANPSDIPGRRLLGRTYMSMGRYEQAAEVYAELYELAPDDPQVLLSYADALGMTQGGRLAGRPAALVQEALEQHPEHPQALWMAGMVARQAGKPEQALAYWKRLEPKLEPGSQNAESLERLMTQTREELPAAAAATGETKATSATAESASTDKAADTDKAAAGNITPPIAVQVKLAASLQAKVGEQATVFVTAKALQGLNMPLAVAQLAGSELPATVKLTDDMAMLPGLQLSQHGQVKLSALLSQSGTAERQSGDLISKPVTISGPRDEPVELVIDQKIP